FPLSDIEVIVGREIQSHLPECAIPRGIDGSLKASAPQARPHAAIAEGARGSLQGAPALFQAAGRSQFVLHYLEFDMLAQHGAKPRPQTPGSLEFGVIQIAHPKAGGGHENSQGPACITKPHEALDQRNRRADSADYV